MAGKRTITVLALSALPLADRFGMDVVAAGDLRDLCAGMISARMPSLNSLVNKRRLRVPMDSPFFGRTQLDLLSQSRVALHRTVQPRGDIAYEIVCC
jgi:hypothetical protein